MPGTDDLVRLERIPVLRRRGRLVLGGGEIGAKSNEAQRQSGKTQGGAHRMLH